jgi:hypothetical protein
VHIAARRPNLSSVAPFLPCVSIAAHPRLRELPRAVPANAWRAFPVFVGELGSSIKQLVPPRELAWLCAAPGLTREIKSQIER